MWTLNKENDQPIYQQIVGLILNAIDQGQLLPGEKIPAERKLASYLNVNRTTIVHALDELVAMGVVVRKPGSGTRIADGKWGVYRGSTIDWRQYLMPKGNSPIYNYQEKVQGMLDGPLNNKLIDAHSGDIPLGLVPELDLPTISWKDFLKEEKLQDEYGYLPLRKFIINRLNSHNQLNIEPLNLMLTSGTQQALLLLIQVLLNPGDSVAIEGPSSFYQLPIFQAAGIRVYGIPVDEEGMQVSFLEERILKHKIKLVLINPNFQNPTGTTMSLKRRNELITLCQKFKLPIIEDDVFGELAFEGVKKLPLLKKLDPDNVIYVGSFSKILGATTKIGWINGPAKVIEKVATIRNDLNFNISIFPQVLALKAMENQTYEEQMIQLKAVLFRRMTALVSALSDTIGDEIAFFTPQGGCYLWVTFTTIKMLPSDYDELLLNGLIVTPGFILGGDAQSFRLNFSRLTTEQSLELVNILSVFINKKISQND